MYVCIEIEEKQKNEYVFKSEYSLYKGEANVV